MRIRHLRVTTSTAIILILLGNLSYAQGSLSNISVDLSSNKAGVEAIYTFTFTTSASGIISDSGKVEFLFPPGFDVSGVVIAQSKNSNLNGGFEPISIENKISADEDTVRLTRDSTGNDIPGSTEVSIAIGMVGNHTSVGGYNVEIRTMTSDKTIIDTGTAENIGIDAGPLHHFQVVTSGNATAGQNFAVTITAQDAYNNTVTTDPNIIATLYDKTGTIDPTQVEPFIDGVWSGNLTFKESCTFNQITVTYNEKYGVSAFFNVFHGELDHFTFDTISSPQTAGTPFNISITAQDQYDNKVISFNDSVVTLTDKSGSLNTTSDSFVSGVLNQNITITKSQNDDQITATDLSSGKNGQSNTFNINSGTTIDHIIVRNNPGGLGNEVGNLSLNLNNQVILYASGYDQWDNYVREVKANWVQTGTLDPPSTLQGTSTTFIPTTPQTSGQIYADSSGMRDYTGTITVGNIHHVLIRDAADGGGNVVNAKTVTADDTLTLYAAAYDEGNNYLGPTMVDWSSSGSLQPAISYSGMPMITFAPTAAPASGRILADHETAIDYTTGIITVNPGAPVGKIVLHPIPKSIPAHQDSSSTITSDVIYDSDGNPIASGELFTVSTSIGKITSPVDQAPGIVGHQVKSNLSSQINFTINADSIGGTAIIHVNSVGKGSAFGDTVLIISNIEIVSINTDIEKVSQGQHNVPVRMIVKNRCPEPMIIQSDGAGLRFKDSKSVDRSGDYTVIRTDTFSVIPSFGGQKVLTFEVDVATSAIVDTITINGNVTGLVNGKPVSDTLANQIDKWFVQMPPNLRIERIEASADTVVQGTITTVAVTIRNDGDASLFIDSDSLTFWAVTQNKNVTDEYIQIPFPSNPDTITGHTSKILSYSVQIGTAATLDTIILNAKVTGHDVNTNVPYTDYNADFLDGWRIKQASEVAISKFLPSQMNVTSGQDSDWYLTMAVNNSGGVDLKLDSVKVRFTIGGFDISNEYQVLEPDSFLFSGNDTLLAGNRDTLKMTIDKTGSTLGTITIEGIVYLDDMISGQIIKNGITGIIVQAPAQLKIDYVRTSQPEVTVAQTFPWKTIVALTNSGGSDIAIDSTQIQDFISFADDPNFVVTPPASFYNSRNFILKEGYTDSLLFNIDITGTEAGNRQITVKIVSKEINSNRNITAQKNTNLKVELPANIRISKTENMAPNAPYVDTEQMFQVAVVVENLGQDAARDIAISLATDSLSTVLNRVDTLSLVQGGHSDTLKFNIQAYSAWIISEVFTARIDAARAENTPEPDKIFISSAIDSADTATVQKPAKMKIVSVISSQDTVKALSIDEWQIIVAVQDSGAGFIQLNQPAESDITILIEGKPQQDYTIVPPTSFKNSQDLILTSWEEDTLIYRVTSTGRRPGLSKIKVNLSGKYLNKNIQFQVADSTAIFIQSSADVYIDITEPDCPNINQYGIGQVNTNQQFTVRTKIRNTVGDQVDNVIVSLTSGGYSIKPDTIGYIPQSGNASANFDITAQHMPVERVNFIAKIESATSHEGGLPVTIGLASDSVASVRIHEPALLKLSINRADSIFTIGRSGYFRVKVENLGTAEVDSSGEIYVQMPAGYHVVVNDQQKTADTTGFKIDEQILWQIQPPTQRSISDTIIVAISKPPSDRNTGSFAEIQNTDPYDTLIVKTVPSILSINSFQITAPEGATDDTLSTFQDFWVQVDVSASENMTNIRASLTLPEDYGYGVGEDSVKNLVNKKAIWKLKASETAHSVPKWIKVKVTGTAGSEEQSVVNSIGVVTQNRAFLSFSRVEISWPETTDSTLSIGQEFDLSATIENSGEAELKESEPGYLKLNFGATGVTSVQQDTIKPFVPKIPVTWRLKAPDVETIKAAITVYIDTIPKDENTNEPATIQNRTKDFYVETQQSGKAWIDSLWITSPSGALDKELSTYQTFTIEANVRWQFCRDVPRVTLHLVGGFTTEESNPKTPSGTAQQERVKWKIKAPEVPTQDQPIWLTLLAYDKNSGREFTVTSDSLVIDVVNRAEIQFNAKIISPASATDYIVSTGEKFIVGAFVSNSGDAKLSGNYSATIVPPEGYTLLDYKTQTTAHDDTLFWTIEAPFYEREAKIIDVVIESAPKDENSSDEVVPDAITVRKASLTIQTEDKSVIISTFSPRNKNTIARGDTAVAMLGLVLTCSGNANSNNVLLSGVKVKLKDRFGNLIYNPRRVVSRIAVVKYRESSLFYGQTVNIPSSNPIEILFGKIDTLRPEIPNKIEFQVDIFANTDITDFQISIDSTEAIYLVDEGSGQVPKLRSTTGQKLEVLNIESESSVIIEADFHKAFFNYPNPFGNLERPQTYFVYYLDQDTDVNIKIYTLIGEMVWSCSYTVDDPQGKKGPHEADIVWDGRNGQGYRVLNGVYIARISTGYGKNTLTKIAVIK